MNKEKFEEMANNEREEKYHAEMEHKQHLSDGDGDTCFACNGSGEGGYDGSTCTVCGGWGEV